MSQKRFQFLKGLIQTKSYGSSQSGYYGFQFLKGLIQTIDSNTYTSTGTHNFNSSKV